MKTVVRLVVGIALFSVTTLRAADDPAKAGRPNVLILYADDLGYTDLACQGSDYYETPNLDRFSKEGMVFTDGYAAAANCAPSRAALLTGAYSPRTEVYTVAKSRFLGPITRRKLISSRGRSKLKPELVTMAEALKANGYQTCHVGKWHLDSDPTKHGFDINIGGHGSGFPRSYFSPYENRNLPDGPEGEHLPDRLAREACKWMKEKKDGGPFFVYLSFYSVHGPFGARHDLAKKYEKKPAAENHFHVTYAAMVEGMDQAVGDVLAYLDESGLADNTMVIFTSDNGPHGRVSTARPLRGRKAMYYEGGIREPFFVRCPGITRAGSVNEAPVHQVDIYPTVLEYTGTALPEGAQPIDGISLMPALRGEALPNRALYWHFPTYSAYETGLSSPDSISPYFRTTPVGVIRHGDWKLMEYFEDGKLELYNLKEDISEQNNVAEKHPAEVARLHGMMKEWRRETAAPVPTDPNPKYDPETKNVPDDFEYKLADRTSAKARSAGRVPRWWKSEAAKTAVKLRN